MKIKNQTTGIVIDLSRDIYFSHPAWVHEQMDTESESELQQNLDQYDFADMAANIGKPDVCGVFIGQDEYDLKVSQMDNDSLAEFLGDSMDLSGLSHDHGCDASASVVWLDSDEKEWEFPCYMKKIDGGRRVIMWSNTDEAGVADITVEDAEDDIDQQIQDFAENAAPGIIATDEMR